MDPYKLHASEGEKGTITVVISIYSFIIVCCYLQDFQETNFSALRKITKKHDKMTNRETGSEWMKRIVSTSILKDDKNLSKLKDRIEVRSCFDLKSVLSQISM